MDIFQRLRSGYDSLPTGEEAQFLNGEKRGNASRGDDSEDKPLVTRGKLLSIAGLFFILLLISGLAQRGEEEEVEIPEVHIEPGAQFLHVLIDANNKGPNLCKNLVSLGSLNYPIPSIINWHNLYNSTAYAEGGVHIARITSVLSYINYTSTMGRGRNEDVMILVDGYDSWFQLRPDAMIERFFEVNRLANNRVVEKLGQAAMDAGGIRQRIVFGVQNKCSGEDGDLECFAVPQSPLPVDAYGKGNEAKRDRFLNSNFIMGEVGALKKLFTKAEDIIKADEEHGTLQAIMARLFGEQEYQREIVNKRYRDLASQSSWFGSGYTSDILAPKEGRKSMDPAPTGEAEFNIGLDYFNLLSTTTDNSEGYEWIVRNDSQAISLLAKAANIPSPSKELLTLPPSIERSLEPFWSRNPNDTIPQELGWKDTPLFTNLHTGATPASIQHSSPRMPESPNLRTTGWQKMWYYNYTKTLLDEHVNEPYRSFAILRGGDGRETAWWPLHLLKWRIRDHEGWKVKKEWIGWFDVCGWDGIEQAVWGDEKGWTVPRIEY